MRGTLILFLQRRRPRCVLSFSPRIIIGAFAASLISLIVSVGGGGGGRHEETVALYDLPDLQSCRGGAIFVAPLSDGTAGSVVAPISTIFVSTTLRPIGTSAAAAVFPHNARCQISNDAAAGQLGANGGRWQIQQTTAAVSRVVN